MTHAANEACLEVCLRARGISNLFSGSATQVQVFTVGFGTTTALHDLKDKLLKNRVLLL